MEHFFIVLLASNHDFDDICKFAYPFGSLLNWFQQCNSAVTVTAPFGAKVAMFVFGFRWAWNLCLSFCWNQIMILKVSASLLAHLDHCLTDFSSVLVQLQLRHLLVRKLPYLYLASGEHETFKYHVVCIKLSFWRYLQDSLTIWIIA